jgi:16S rRNA (cytidine1402-2'-O)-methyltransferase
MDRPPFAPRPATLYIVATPIGNLRDITLRALDVLGAVDCIAAEDTRITGVLLGHFGIAARTIALHAHNERQRAEVLVRLLADGKSVALVTDAGTPGLSDPGAELVGQVRRAGFAVEPIPGPSALTAALSVTGWPASPFTFHGFLPSRGAARAAALAAAKDATPAQIFFEAPHRIVEMLDDLRAAFGGERRITIAREVTKRFETIHESTLAAAIEWIGADADRRRGEFVLIVEGAPAAPREPGAPGPEDERLFRLLRAALPASRAAKLAAEITGKSRDDFYRMAKTASSAAAAADAED